MIATALGRGGAASGEQVECVLGAAHRGGVGRVELRGSRVVYVCDCLDELERSLTEVYVTRLTGMPRERGKGEYVRWKVRLLIEAGVLQPPPVVLPPLGSDATAYARRVHDRLGLFVQVRVLTDAAGDPFTFTRRFAAEWCGLGVEQANAGIKALVRADVLAKVGTVPVGQHDANLYVVGTGITPAARIDAAPTAADRPPRGLRTAGLSATRGRLSAA